MKKLMIIQPYLVPYRLSLFNDFSDYRDITLLFDYTGEQDQKSLVNKLNGKVQIRPTATFSFFRKRLFYQRSVVKEMLNIRPEEILVFANTRYISTWAVMFIGKLIGTDVYLYGHGTFKKKKVTILLKAIYLFFMKLSKKYICYNEYSYNHFVNCMGSSDKLGYVSNVIELGESSKPVYYRGLSFLFIGRLREGSGIEEMLNVMKNIASSGVEIRLGIIGSGELQGLVEGEVKETGWLSYFGEIYDNDKIREIADEFSYGIYLGNSGLSILHFMALGLVPITHSSLNEHSGPEPAYVSDGTNGILLKKYANEFDALELLRKLDAFNYNHLAENCLSTYNHLTASRFAMRFINFFEEGENS